MEVFESNVAVSPLMSVNKMDPSKCKRSERRRSSILKPRKTRQPLQNVNLDSSSNENSPVTAKVKRRVSFAEKKHVKEFCHSTEQGTVWDNTYEEHDFSSKGSFVVEQNTQVEPQEIAPLCASKDYIDPDSNSCDRNNTHLVNNQLSQESAATANEDDDANSDLDFTNPVKSIQLSDTSLLGYDKLPNKSYVCEGEVSSGIVAYSDTDEECIELPDKKSQPQPTVISANTSCAWKNQVNSSNIAIYRDSDEEYHAEDNDAAKSSKSCSSNVDSKFDKTLVQDLSMELTAPIPVFLLSHLQTEQKKKQKCNDINNVDTDYCNNVSMEITEAVPVFATSVASDLKTCQQISTMSQKCTNTKCDADNTHHTIDDNYANDSMALTSVVQPFTDVTGTGIHRALDTSMEMVSVPAKILVYENNACKENDLRKDATDKTEIFNCVPMEMTQPVSTILSPSVYNKENVQMDGPISRDDKTMYFYDVSMETTKIVSTNCKRKIPDINTCKSLSEKNTHGGKDINESACFDKRTNLLCKSMEFTETVPTLCNERMLHAAHVAQSVNDSTCEDYKNDKTEFFNDSSMEITKSVNMLLPLHVDKENLNMDELTPKGDKTMLFHNVSMEMTTAISRNRNEITQSITGKSMSRENTCGEREPSNLICFNEETQLLCKSVEFTEAVPTPLCNERTFHAAHVAQTVNKSTWEDKENDGTEVFNDLSMEITKSVNMLPLDIDEKNLKIDQRISKDKTVSFHNVSMEMTAPVSSRNRDETIQPITYKSMSKENSYVKKDTTNSTCFNERTKLLCKSMEFTQVVPISLHEERTFDTCHAAQSTCSQTLSKTTLLPAQKSAEEALQTNAVANETIQTESMEITAAVPPTLQLVQDVIASETENLILPKNDEFQHLMANNNLTTCNKSTTRENFTIPRETENIEHNELSNVTQPPLDNLDYCPNANLENASGKKRMSDASERLLSKRARTSFMQVQSFEDNNIHSFSSGNANCANDIERNESLIKDTMNHTQVSQSNLKENEMDLNEISENSFLTRSMPYLKNSLVELHSINPPSCLESEEENSFYEIQHELQSPTITDIAINNISDRSITNNAESEYLRDKLINENNQADYHVGDKTEDNQQVDNCQTITRTIMNDHRPDKLNYCTTKSINEESISSMNAENGKTPTVQDINHYTSVIVKELEMTDEDQAAEREYTRKGLNEDTQLQNDIQEYEQYSDEERQETEKCNNHLEGAGAVVEGQIESKECEKSFNNEATQSMEQQDECAIERPGTPQYISTIEDIKNKSLNEQDPFLIFLQKLQTHAARDDCIWNVYHKNIDKKLIVFDFMSNSLLIATYLSHDFNGSEESVIKEIKIISRISDDAEVLIRIVHKLILEKINVEILTKLYRTHQDILPMLDFISQDVKLAMDFMFDLRRLDDLNLMEIAYDQISFVSRSKQMDIILQVTIKVKQFNKLTSNDISLHCLLGKNRIKETDIKNLFKNIKRDYKFLRRYMNDVKDYIDIIEETIK
ncbi:PREDICTED: uncharacterized protein LOC105562972 [Vollenhovia emeryi]|uniref:uncharacterized protein LOC105562972 n=1 Tax=Vollenhovia emeryi TaxID=411798 RepID=UPI0005F584BF|nr:PREDICTED: uncharacterized protein LOC105562972 [Vollenhovia emeryi]